MFRKMIRTTIGAGLVLGIWAGAPVMAAESAGGHDFPAMQPAAFDRGAIVSNTVLRQARGGGITVPGLAVSAHQMPVVMLWDELPIPATSSNTPESGGSSRGHTQGGVRLGAPQSLVPILPNVQNLPASVVQSPGSFSGQ
jgi:hypothetical protein